METAKLMCQGVPYHRLLVEQKLCVLEFLVDEMLSLCVLP